MDEIEFSPEAIDVLNQFYEVGEVVLVEGDEDAPFWRFLFQLFYSKPVKVRGVGGKPSLDKYIEELSKRPRNYCVAVDSDYDFLFEPHRNDRVLCTYGHSIENSMICGRTLCQVIQSYALVDNDEIAPAECWEWLLAETAKLESHIPLELENFRSYHGERVLGKNCAAHCANSSSSKLDEDKLDECIRSLGFSAKDETVKEIREEIERGKLVKDMIRGHYLFSLSLRYVKNSARRFKRKISLSNESLFSAILMAFQLTFAVGHEHYEHYEKQFRRLSV